MAGRKIDEERVKSDVREQGRGEEKRRVEGREVKQKGGEMDYGQMENVLLCVLSK